MRYFVLLMAVLSLCPSAAKPVLADMPRPPGAPAASAPALRLDFAVFAAGLNVMNVETGVAMDGGGYRVGAVYRTAGALSLLFQGENRATVEGVWREAIAAPLRFVSGGTWRGSKRRIEMNFVSGQPLVKVLVPPNDNDEREPVPEAMKRNTTDSLSALAMLVHAVAETGHCDGGTITFDGRRVVQLRARTAGMENLPRDSRSSFAGPALRCEFEGQQIAGFPTDVPAEESHRVQHGTAWFASLTPGLPALPVRLNLQVRILGEATVYLKQTLPLANFDMFTPPPQ